MNPPTVAPCCREAIDKSQFVAVLRIQNRKLEQQRDEAVDVICEALQHYRTGDLEALGAVLEGWFN